MRDTGIGIRPEFLPLVFDRFRQAEAVTSRKHAGLGLGLAIARQLVELHNGTITAHSEGEGRGALFTVSLPLERRSDLTSDELPSERALDLAKDTLHGLDVLLVEDERATEQAEQHLLQAAGAHVRTAASAAAAREAFALGRPDVIVCDIGLPDEDGYVFMRSIRALEREAQADPVLAVAVTAFVRREDRQRALAAGFNEHLPKPVDPALLIELLGRWRGVGQGPLRGM